MKWYSISILGRRIPPPSTLVPKRYLHLYKRFADGVVLAAHYRALADTLCSRSGVAPARFIPANGYGFGLTQGEDHTSIRRHRRSLDSRLETSTVVVHVRNRSRSIPGHWTTPDYPRREHHRISLCSKIREFRKKLRFCRSTYQREFPITVWASAAADRNRCKALCQSENA